MTPPPTPTPLSRRCVRLRGRLRDDPYHIFGDLEESPLYSKSTATAAASGEPDRAGTEQGDEWRVAREDPHIAIERRSDHPIGLAVEDDPLW